MSATRRLGQRKLLKHCCAAILHECGAKDVSANCLTLMTELLDAFLSELAVSARRYAEQAGRNIPIPADVLAALVDMGFELTPLIDFSRQPKRLLLPQVSVADVIPDFVVEQMFAPEPPKPRPNAVSDHLPPFPPPHTYVRTGTQSSPALSYQLVRERSASQRRSVERALVKLLAASNLPPDSLDGNNGESAADIPSLFKGDPHSFPILPPRYDDQPWLRLSKNLNEDSLAANIGCGTEPSYPMGPPSIPLT